MDDANSSTHLYRIAQEAITNAIKHGKAKRIKISLKKTSDEIALTVGDDGIGLPENRRGAQGMGLRIMGYRAGMIGANFKIERMEEAGTRVTCKLPLKRPAISEIHGAKN